MHRIGEADEHDLNRVADGDEQQPGVSLLGPGMYFLGGDADIGGLCG